MSQETEHINLSTEISYAGVLCEITGKTGNYFDYKGRFMWTMLFVGEDEDMWLSKLYPQV